LQWTYGHKILCKNLNVKIKKIFHFSLGLTRFPKLIFYLNLNCKVEGPNPLQTAYLSSYLSTCYKVRSKFGKASTRVVVTVLCSSLNASSIMDWSFHPILYGCIETSYEYDVIKIFNLFLPKTTFLQVG
jgi:hypothetical protein